MELPARAWPWRAGGAGRLAAPRATASAGQRLCRTSPAEQGALRMGIGPLGAAIGLMCPPRFATCPVEGEASGTVFSPKGRRPIRYRDRTGSPVESGLFTEGGNGSCPFAVGTRVGTQARDRVAASPRAYACAFLF
jgi:hypothetical protein